MTIVDVRNHGQLASRNLDRFQNQNDTVCTWTNCGNDADQNLDAPICMEHAKKLAVQVMLLTSKTPQTSKPVEDDPSTSSSEALINPAPLTKGLVYFIKFDNRIKIGFTTNLPQRMRAIPHDEILALMPGTQSNERMLHKKFDGLRVKGEWFTAGPQLVSYIQRIPRHPLLAG